MPYSLVSAATLGFDLVRLPAGDHVAQVLLTGLGAGPLTLQRLAGAHADAGDLPADRAARARRNHELAAAAVPQLRDDPGPGGSVPDQTARLVALLERGTIGNAPALQRLVRGDVLGPEHPAVADLDPLIAARAGDVLADAAVGWWAAEGLPDVALEELTGPYRAAVGLRQVPQPGLGPATDRLQRLLDEFARADPAHRQAWRAAVDGARAGRRSWAQAMHGAAWAAHLSGRTHTLAAAQLTAVQAFAASGFSPLDGAQGVWNALAGCVQAVSMADLLDDEATAVLAAPWTAVTGLPLPG